VTLSGTEADDPGGRGFEATDAPALGGGRGSIVDKTLESAATEPSELSSTNAAGVSLDISAILKTR